MPKKGILLVNLGTPDSPEPEAVGRYLKEFLMDPYVIDIPYPLRALLVKGIIVPRRSGASSLLYKKIWNQGGEGSPLLRHTLELARKVAARATGYRVLPAMRYGSPSMASALATFREEGVTDVLVAPLYPQYSLAATQSSVVEAKAQAAGLALEFLPAFYDDAHYLDAVAAVSRPHLEGFDFQKVLFSFHGLPERQVKKTDPTGRHCLRSEGCCDRIEAANRDCYRAQSFATARELAKRLGLSPDQYLVAFQSRLNQRWLRPFSDDFYRDLPSRGVKRLAVICPSFVADCLETLEEVSLRGASDFRAHGGEELRLVPSLNAEEAWVNALTEMVRSFDQSAGHRAAGQQHQRNRPDGEQGQRL